MMQILLSKKPSKKCVDKLSFNACAKSLPLPSHRSRLPVTINDTSSLLVVDTGICVSVDKVKAA